MLVSVISSVFCIVIFISRGSTVTTILPQIILMNHYQLALTTVQINFFEEPQNIFSKQNPRPQTIQPVPRIFNYRVPLLDIKQSNNFHCKCRELLSSYSPVNGKASNSDVFDVCRSPVYTKRLSIVRTEPRFESSVGKKAHGDLYKCRNQGGSKNGRRTFGIFWEDCYAREISRFVCNKVRLF